MTTKLNTNGQARKSLAEQIDRLDAVLDGLAEGINDTVVAAVKEAVGAAVQAVLREVLSSPELLARLAVAVPNATQPAEKPTVSWKNRWAAACQALLTWLAAARAACNRGLAAVRVKCIRLLELARGWAVGALLQLRLLGQFKYQIVTALAVSLGAGVAAYFAARGWRRRPAASARLPRRWQERTGVAARRLLTQIAGPVG